MAFSPSTLALPPSGQSQTIWSCTGTQAVTSQKVDYSRTKYPTSSVLHKWTLRWISSHFRIHSTLPGNDTQVTKHHRKELNSQQILNCDNEERVQWLSSELLSSLNYWRQLLVHVPAQKQPTPGNTSLQLQRNPKFLLSLQAQLNISIISLWAAIYRKFLGVVNSK